MITCGPDTGKSSHHQSDPRLTDPRIEALHEQLQRLPVVTVPPEAGVRRAAVALVVRPEPGDLELLLIKRTVFAGDPWSGHMAFPGGRSDPEDPDAVATAVRETCEEVAVDLRATGTLLGALDEVQPGTQTLQIVVSPFVFSVPPGTPAIPNHEVEATVWIPIRELLQPDAALEHLYEYGAGEPLRFPALGYGGYVIWGLTHRILLQFLEIAAPAYSAGRRG